jgi:hypothetical protein
LSGPRLVFRSGSQPVGSSHVINVGRQGRRIGRRLGVSAAGETSTGSRRVVGIDRLIFGGLADATAYRIDMIYLGEMPIR